MPVGALRNDTTFPLFCHWDLMRLTVALSFRSSNRILAAADNREHPAIGFGVRCRSRSSLLRPDTLAVAKTRRTLLPLHARNERGKGGGGGHLCSLWLRHRDWNGRPHKP